jgi:hypothetical protein
MTYSSLRMMGVALAGTLLVACGGGGEDNSASTPPSGNTPGGSGVAKLSWSAPAYNADGTPTTDLAGYRVYHGRRADALDEVIQVAGATHTSYSAVLSSGIHYFAVAAYTTDGLEGPLSAIRSKVVP